MYIYLVEVYLMQENSWNLIDSCYYSCKEEIEGIVSPIIKKYNNFSIIKYVELFKIKK